MSKIINVRKNADGNICAVKLDNGSEISLQDAVELANHVVLKV